MINVKIVCVGKMKQRFYLDAFGEYVKRLGAYCRFECVELNEYRLGDDPSEKEIISALDKEAVNVLQSIPQDAFTVAMCVEGKLLSSEDVAKIIFDRENSGKPKLCFVIGGSYGLSPLVKQRADLRMSMSKMSFPHHLARVMLAEQIYRGFKINEGSKYHK